MVASTSETHARAVASYLGFAVGDALGAPLEFMTEREIARAHKSPVKEMIGGGWLALRPGEVTDDTQMSLALGDAILEASGWDMESVARHFSRWLRSGPVDVGNTCRRGIQRYLKDGSLQGPVSEGDGGNGALMRNLPVVLFTLRNAAAFERFSLQQARFTHNHPLSDAATLALGHITRALIGGEGKAEARRIGDDLVSRHRAFRFDEGRGPCSAYVVDTVKTVLHAFFHTESFEACLIQVVNKGGDADTAGALAGMLAGACYGPAAIPGRWLRRLNPGARLAVEEQANALMMLRETAPP